MASEDLFSSEHLDDGIQKEPDNIDVIDPNDEESESHKIVENNEPDDEFEDIPMDEDDIDLPDDQDDLKELEEQDDDEHDEKEQTTESAVAETSTTDKTSSKNKLQEMKLVRLPLARIRNLMKLDPDLQMTSNEAIFTVAKATELFIESLAKEAYTYTAQAKKKTIQKRDVELTFMAVDSLMFLEGAMNW